MVHQSDALLTRETVHDEVAAALAGSGPVAVVVDRSPARPTLHLAVSAADHDAVAAVINQLDWQWRTPAAVPLGGRRTTWTFPGGTRAMLLTPPRLPMHDDELFASVALDGTGDVGRGLVEATAAVRAAYLLAAAGPGALGRQKSLHDEVRDLVADGDQRLGGLLGRARQQRTLRAAEVVWPGLRLEDRRTALRSSAWSLGRRLRDARARSASDAVTTCKFDGLELLAGPETFWPRRRSEALVAAAEHALHQLGGRASRVIDVGTGCGAVALAIAQRVDGATVLAADSEEAPLVWLRKNVTSTGLSGRVIPCRSDLLGEIPDEWSSGVDLVVGNIPCIPASDFTGAGDTGAVGYVGVGSDGLGLHRRLLDQADSVVAPDGALCIQSRPAEVGALVDMAASFGWDLRDHRIEGNVSVLTLGRS